MKQQVFNKFFEFITNKMRDILAGKSADYSAGNDKLFNFKLAGQMDGVTPVEALRGMHLKHRASIRQGLDDLIVGKVRSKEWWLEKTIDDMNYTILMLALLEEEFWDEE